MTPQEALKILDQIASVVQVNRQDHQNIETALSVLSSLIDEKTNKDN